MGIWIWATIVALFPIAVSPVAMLIIRRTLEGGKPEGMFNPRTQSWAFLFGDTCFLPAMLFVSTYVTYAYNANLVSRWWFVALSPVVGIAASYGFRIMDAVNYVKSGHRDRLFSRSKMWHDRQVYVSVATLAFYLGIPAVLTFTVWGWLAFACFGLWILAGVCDGIRTLDPANLHPRVQETALARFA